MINSIQLLRNIGLFDSVSAGANVPLAQLTLFYAENGRGKTTLAAVLRSLATGDPVPVTGRRRLAAQRAPHVVLVCDGGPPAAMFENGAWNRTLPNLVVFDDTFIDENVHSGLAVASGHRQNLHELILGAQAVVLNRELQHLVGRIEEHNAALRVRAAAVPITERANLSVDDFCALPALPMVEAAIESTERTLAAAREQGIVRNTARFDSLSLPALNIASIEAVLGESLPTLDAAAAEQVQAHLAVLGRGGEAWINEGMRLVSRETARAASVACPFCAQDLGGSVVMNHYRAYFSEGYRGLGLRVSEAIGEANRVHGGDRPAAFERAVSAALERRRFWSQFGDIPEITLDTGVIARDWRSAVEAVTSVLARKQAAPLDAMALPGEARVAVAVYDAHRRVVAALSAELQRANTTIDLIKERAVSANSAAITADLLRLRATRARHTPPIAGICDDYLNEKAAKTATELLRDRKRADLEQYRTTVFAGYQTAVNMYLQRFNAGFRLDSVTSTNTRGGPACTYNVLINNVPIPVGAEVSPGEPSFRNTLSAGDRNTLALAFFFASLDQDSALSNKIVVIDDPVSSLDDHRCLTTIQEIRRLAARAGQVIVLSHNKPFLCRVWEGSDAKARAALHVTRDGTGSSIGPWDVDQDCVTEHDRRHAMLREYLESGTPSSGEVAKAIRPVVEAFLRVSSPGTFGPGTLLGPFLNLSRQRLGTPQEILSRSAIDELADLVEYANKFHHDTNEAWQTERINDGELQGFVRRALNFTRPPVEA